MRPTVRWFIPVFLGSAISILFVMASATLAEPQFRVNKDANNVAILGYDPVAYFTEGGPVEGQNEFVHIWQDAEWHFASAEHQDMFAQNPERYAPRYGGYCAAGVARGLLLNIEPNAWIIIDGKLYLNYDATYTKEFLEDAPSQIDRADDNWKHLGKI